MKQKWKKSKIKCEIKNANYRVEHVSIDVGEELRADEIERKKKSGKMSSQESIDHTTDDTP